MYSILGFYYENSVSPENLRIELTTDGINMPASIETEVYSGPVKVVYAHEAQTHQHGLIEKYTTTTQNIIVRPA